MSHDDDIVPSAALWQPAPAAADDDDDDDDAFSARLHATTTDEGERHLPHDEIRRGENDVILTDDDDDDSGYRDDDEEAMMTTMSRMEDDRFGWDLFPRRASGALRGDLVVRRLRRVTGRRRDLRHFPEPVPEEWLDDEAIVWEMRDWRFFSLSMVSSRLRGKRDFVLPMVRYDGWSLQHAQRDLRGDDEIVTEAVKQNGKALAWANAAMKDNIDVVMEAVKNEGEALRYASEGLRRNFWIVLTAVQTCTAKYDILQSASPELRDNFAIVMPAVKRCFRNIASASPKMRNHYQIVLTAVTQHGNAYLWASEELQANPKIYAIALQTTSYDHLKPPDSLRMRLDVVHDAMKTRLLWGSVSDEDGYRVYAEETWKRSCRAKLFALEQLLTRNGIDRKADWKRTIIEFSDIPHEFHLANELNQLAPVFGALSQRGVRWEYIIENGDY